MQKTMIALFLLSATVVAQAEEPTLRFGVDPTFAPYESVDPQGNLEGIDIDMGNYICKDLKVKCSWERLNFDGAIPALKARKIDAILSGMTITKAREKQVLFSTPMYQISTRLMVRKDRNDILPTVAALKGKTLGLVQGTSQAAYAVKHWSNKGIQFNYYQNDDLQKQDLSLGRLDAALQDTGAAEAYFLTAAGKNLKLVGPALQDPSTLGDGNAIGMLLGNTALKQKIDTAIRHMHEDGTYAKIMKKYESFGLIPVADK